MRPRPPISLARWVVAAIVAGAAGFGPAARAESLPTMIEVVGDSQAQGLAGALERLFLRRLEFRVLDRSKISPAGYDVVAARLEPLIEEQRAKVALGSAPAP
jgi:hypothetical protein